MNKEQAAAQAREARLQVLADEITACERALELEVMDVGHGRIDVESIAFRQRELDEAREAYQKAVYEKTSAASISEQGNGPTVDELNAMHPDADDSGNPDGNFEDISDDQGNPIFEDAPKPQGKPKLKLKLMERINNAPLWVKGLLWVSLVIVVAIAWNALLIAIFRLLCRFMSERAATIIINVIAAGGVATSAFVAYHNVSKSIDDSVYTNPL